MAHDSERLKGDFVAGVIDEPAEVDSALKDLTAEGIADDAVHVFSGAAGRARIEHLGGDGWTAKLRRGMDDFVGNAHDLRVHHEDEAERGHFVLIVNVPHGAMLDRAHHILDSHRAHDVVTRSGGGFWSGASAPRAR